MTVRALVNFRYSRIYILSDIEFGVKERGYITISTKRYPPTPYYYYARHHVFLRNLPTSFIPLPFPIRKYIHFVKKSGVGGEMTVRALVNFRYSRISLLSDIESGVKERGYITISTKRRRVS